MSYKIYSRNCDLCGKFYTGHGRFFCSRKCSHEKLKGIPRSEITKKKISVKKTSDINIRFWSKVKITELFDCWEWQGTKHKFGYGQFNIGNKTIVAHRVAYEMYFGSIKNGLWVLHKCNNPSCVNPAHLYLGTQQDNMNDMVAKQRQAFGQRNGHSKLADQDVIEIIKLLKGNKTYKEIGLLFDVTKHAIFHIKNNDTWVHIPR